MRRLLLIPLLLLIPHISLSEVSAEQKVILNYAQEGQFDKAKFEYIKYVKNLDKEARLKAYENIAGEFSKQRSGRIDIEQNRDKRAIDLEIKALSAIAKLEYDKALNLLNEALGYVSKDDVRINVLFYQIYDIKKEREKGLELLKRLNEEYPDAKIYQEVLISLESLGLGIFADEQIDGIKNILSKEDAKNINFELAKKIYDRDIDDEIALKYALRAYMEDGIKEASRLALVLNILLEEQGGNR